MFSPGVHPHAGLRSYLDFRRCSKPLVCHCCIVGRHGYPLVAAFRPEYTHGGLRAIARLLQDTLVVQGAFLDQPVQQQLVVHAYLARQTVVDSIEGWVSVLVRSQKIQVISVQDHGT